MQISEKLRMQLLKEEFKLRKKQPQAWTAQKYRKYANIGVRKKKEKPEFIEEEREMETRLHEEGHRAEKAEKLLQKKAAKRIRKKAAAGRAEKRRLQKKRHQRRAVRKAKRRAVKKKKKR